ncbi:MAG TPA: ABC transporter permease [Terriglobales bacterium]|nr:ABC transporter permease [Terriglobales bacterium]
MRLLLDIVGQTLRTLWAHKLRSFLTMFGIAWGVGSLLLLVGVGEGFRSGNRRQLSQLGEDVIFLFSGLAPAVKGHTGTRQYYLTYDDFQAIKASPAVRNAAAILSRGDIRAVSEFGNSGAGVTGVTPEFNQVRFVPVDAGRWLNDADEAQRRNVAVIAVDLKKNLFPGRPALGSTILLNGVRFEVVGLLQDVSRDTRQAQDTRAFIPYSTMRVYFPLKGVPSDNVISFINYQPRVRGANEEAKRQAHQIIGQRHGFDPDIAEFNEWDTIANQEMVGKIFTAMDLFLGAVGLITLALGAIGVINIMLVSVTERTREIGLLKALGATNRSVLTQFFLEGLFLTLFSGGLGIAAAAGLMRFLHTLPSQPGFDPPTLVPASAALAIGALGFAGIVAGLYPARRAAMLQPVEALRKE